MANIRTLERSFGGGELTPEFFGRIDDVKYQSGLATCRNFIVLPHGPVTNRPGTQYVREVKTSAKKTRLIPFSFSTTQTMVLEFGEQYIRFHTNGATLLSGGAPYEVTTPYLEADLFDLHYVQSADVLTICHPNYAPRELKRISSTSWTLTAPSFAPALTAPSVSVSGNAKGTDYFYQYVVTSVTDKGLSESLASNPAQGASKAITAITKANPGVITTSTAHGFAIGQSVFIKDVVGMTQLNNNYYVVKTVPTTTTFTLEDSAGNVINTTSYSTYVSGGLVYISGVKNNLFVTGGANTITWTDVAGATAYNIYKFSGGLYGYIGQTTGTSFTDDNITADVSKTPPLYDTLFGSSSNYPGAVSYFEQRRCFAGTINEPQNIWMTKSGTESNMTYSLPTLDTDSISFRVAAREANTIRHIVPLNNLVLLTSSAEWRVTSVNSDALTPSTVSVKPQSYIGASNVQPVIVNNNLIYGAARGGHMRELAYNWQASGYVTGDLCLRAPHLFDGYTVVDLAYGKSPQPVVWAVSSNGLLLGLTYVPEQQVGAWHHHDTDGTFESCCVVAEGDEDRLYVVVKRTVNGATKRFVERMSSRFFSSQADAFFVDNGATYNGTNTSATTVTVTGGTTWGPADLLTITASSAIFAYPAQTDVNDAIVLTATDGTTYRLTIVSTTSTTVAQARVDNTLPAAYRSTATASYGFARDSISGLTWLEGKTVNILADGAVHPQRVVTSGSISLDQASTKVQVGLPIIADLQTLPWAAQIDAAFGQGRMKNVNKIWLRVFRSSGIFAGPDANNLTEAKQRTTEPYGTPPELKSQEIEIVISPSWNDSGQVFIRQSDPLPLTAVSMTLEVSIGG